MIDALEIEKERYRIIFIHMLKDAVRHFNALDVVTENHPDANFEKMVALKTEIGYGAVVCLAADLLPIDKKNWYVPAWLI